MDIEKIKNRVIESLEEFLSKDGKLLEDGVNERAITHKIAIYLEKRFKDWSTDCEYNRDRGESKKLNVKLQEEAIKVLDKTNKHGTKKYEIVDGELNLPTTYPDIIVHHRGNNSNNLLIIELKKLVNLKSRVDFSRGMGGLEDDVALDFLKLKGFTAPKVGEEGYGYTLGLFIAIDKTLQESQIFEFIEGVPKEWRTDDYAKKAE